MVSHDTEMIKKNVNKVIWLDMGRINEFGDTNSTVNAYLNFMDSPNVTSKTNENF